MKKTTVFSLAVIVALLALVILARGQEQEPPKAAKEEVVRKVVQLKYADPERVLSLLVNFGANMRSDRRAKVLTIAGRASQVEAVEEAISKLDVPPLPTKDVEVTAYFLLATRPPAEGADLPPELHDVVAQLKKVLNYQSFHLLNSALIRTRDGEGASVTGMVSGGGANQPANFSLNFQDLNIIPAGNSSIVRIERLAFFVREEERSSEGKLVAKEAPTATIQTNIDVPEGQKVVVGKTAFQLPENALVLVLTAKVLD
jgi:type II secretory pathway component GspD/PulD (secretin)